MGAEENKTGRQFQAEEESERVSIKTHFMDVSAEKEAAVHRQFQTMQTADITV